MSRFRPPPAERRATAFALQLELDRERAARVEAERRAMEAQRREQEARRRLQAIARERLASD
jgi:hypothetical protein